VKLQIHDLTVRVCTDEATSGAYRFRCPICHQMVNRAASSRIVDLLVSAGAPHELWQWPAELDERPAGPALTHDDLVALVRRTTPE
jgi:hypothetical protein